MLRALIAKTSGLSSERLLVKVLTLGHKGGGRIFQSAQQASLLSHKSLCHFLRDNATRLYSAYRSKYCELMSAIYLSHFRAEAASANRGVGLHGAGEGLLEGGEARGGLIAGLLHLGKRRHGAGRQVAPTDRDAILRLEWPEPPPPGGGGGGGVDVLPEVAFRLIISVVLR